MNGKGHDTVCRRCGICCEKGGPGLHHEDSPLVENGNIPAKCLYTIRCGELVRDDIRGSLAPLAEEIVKIKGQAGKWTCLFYDRQEHGCRIYDHRPIECRVLNCRDTGPIEQIYDKARLTRRDLLTTVAGLWELVEDHERRCSYAQLGAWVREGTLENDAFKQEEAIFETLRYDAHIRQLAVEKGGLDADLLPFVFGRPLTETIRMFGIDLIKRNGAYGLVRSRVRQGK
ncbi:YkgJ family cysteine cluster protein [uncultured Desulfosarcina sp.]|uniref:YkgJ family cysteine cluster protein n=1 Tax=uncultured Desulfosarcina sp. TaxID=218289 RepID=UPI0029C733AF|nr:YkgJ family cysteine cluster protein [uncultured Desulfosarcina sp.]